MIRPSISPSPISTPWNSRCATCIVRSVENPSLRLASCVSVDVVNGGAGRSTPGFCSTPVTVHGSVRANRPRRARRRPASSSMPHALRSSARRSAASKSLPVATRWSPTRTSVATNSRPSPRQPRFEVPVDAGAERAPLFLALDDEPHGHALHAAGAQAGLHLLPEHRRQRVAVEPIEDAAALLGADEVLVDRRGRARAPR